MKKTFKDISIRSKLIFIQLFTTFIVLSFLGVVIIYNQWKTYKNSTIDQLNSTAQLFSFNLLSPLQFLDSDAAGIILSSLKTQDEIVNAWIFDRHGKLFASYHKKGFKDSTFRYTKKEGMVNKDHFIRLTKMIRDNDGILGFITLRLDVQKRWDLLLGNVYLIGVIFVIGMIIAFFLAVFLERKLTEPLLGLLTKLEQVIHKGNYSIRLEVDSQDEVGFLGTGFNRILNQIEKRDKELNNAREQLQTVLDAVPATISWIDNELNYIGVNKRLADFYKMEQANFVGQHLGFMGNSPDFVEFVENFFRSDQKQTYKEIKILTDGKEFTHLIIGQKYANNLHAVFIGIDITSIKEAEKSVKISEERFSLVLEASNTGIWDFDIVNDKAYYSPRWKSILGYKEDEIKNHSTEWEDRLHPDERKWVIDEFDTYLNNPEGQLTIEYRMRHKDGTYRWIYDRSIALIGDDGKPYRMLGSMYDITLRKQSEVALQKAHNSLESKVAERTRELAEANERLKELDRLKSMFLASMSHELRTPLNSIIGFTGLLIMGLAGEINEEQKKQLGMVKNSANHLLALINDILDISKVEAGKIDLDMEEFDLDKLVDEIVQECAPLIKEKPLELTGTTSENMTINGDRRRIKQIIVNLVSNAIKFTDSGYVNVVTVLKDNDQIEIAVIDSGIGISKENIGKLFSPFQQLDMSSSKKYEGTGLGLHLSRKLAGLMGGKLEVSSEYGKGSTFTFTLKNKYAKALSGE